MLKKSDMTAMALGLALGAASIVPAFAAGGGGDPPPPPTCAKGQVYNALAKQDRFQEALNVLDLLKNPNTPKALNYRGFATRKIGRTEEGISYYLKSVALDPNYAQVREYLGEAYVIQGKFNLAKSQLATIKTICGTGCEEYEDLAQAIEDSKL